MTATVEKPAISVPVFLREYTPAENQTRWLMGQRVDGVPRVIDVPAPGHDGESYVVEPDIREPDGCAKGGVLDALLDDYIFLAVELGYPPMQGWF